MGTVPDLLRSPLAFGDTREREYGRTLGGTWCGCGGEQGAEGVDVFGEAQIDDATGLFAGGVSEVAVGTEVVDGYFDA